MKIKIQSPFKIIREKSISLPTAVKLTDGTVFYTWNPEMLGGRGTYDVSMVTGQMNAYSACAPLCSIINKEADALKNGRFYFLDDKGNEVKPERKDLGALLYRANPIQSFKQFIAQVYAFSKIHGICYVLPVAGFVGGDVKSMYVVPNFMVKPRYTRRLFQQTSLTEIIEGYEVQGIDRLILPNEMIVFRDGGVPNFMEFDRYMQPMSRMVPVQDSINSVIASTDAWVTIAKRKGLPLGIISSGGKDATSTIPLTPTEKDEVHDELNTGYGMSGSMKKFIITSASLNFQAISVPTKDLMILDGIEAHSRIICNAYGYPFRLLEYDTGSSLSNGGEVKEARKTLYVEQIIPDAETICDVLNEYFGLRQSRLSADYSHLEIFQKSKEEGARALLSLTAGLDKAYLNGIITAEEYRMSLSELMNINPDVPYGTTYHITATVERGEGAVD